MRPREYLRAFALTARIVIAITALAGTAAAQPATFSAITGEIGPGALYEIDVPTGPWNGELVVIVHGTVSPAAPVALPTIGPLRDLLTSQGFALVYSSFSENGYAVKDGIQRTHQLRGVFASKVGTPTRVYLLGQSLGGLIAVLLAESHPTQYNGVLSACGPVGGGTAALSYVADARILFDYFFPGTIPGTALDIPAGIDFTPGGATYTRALTALSLGLVAPQQPTLQFARAARLPALTVPEIVAAGMNLAGYSVTFTGDLLEKTHGHLFYDNTSTIYSGSANDAALNAGVERYTSDPSAVKYVEHYGTPTGDIRMPVVTLHTTRDPLVPLFHEQLFAQAVQTAGASDLLVQRTVNAFGHCAFSTADAAAAFASLIGWVHTGVKPAF